MGSLLIDERPLVVLPGLVKKLGSIDRAIILQQIHWLSSLPNSGVEHDGKHWVWGTMAEWVEQYFPMWTVAKLKRELRWLRQHGYIETAQLRASDWDRTNHYRVVPERLNDEQTTGTPETQAKGASVTPSPGTSVNQAKGTSVNPSSISTETTTETTTENKRSEPDEVRQVFDHWQQVMDTPRSKLCTNRRRKIRARLADGYTVADLMAAIDGCKRSDWHMGKNPNKRLYNSIDLICRDSDKVEAFMEVGQVEREREQAIDDWVNSPDDDSFGAFGVPDDVIEGEVVRD